MPIVFDPVMVASSGALLADAATISAFDRLAKVATVTTPNVPELAVLVGRELAAAGDVEAAAQDFVRDKGKAVLAKGGHLAGARLTDLLVEPGGALRRWHSDRIETSNTHGTGCTLASGIACGLAQGLDLAAAIDRARHYVRLAILAAPGFGRGHGPMGHALGTVPWNIVRNAASGA
jgi:hydroxymethylpyrimidine/phosphomethylpyrimidine kinase